MFLASGMPKVDLPPDTEERFTKTWLVASGKKPANPTADPSGERCVVNRSSVSGGRSTFGIPEATNIRGTSA